jgi:dipeptidase D
MESVVQDLEPKAVWEHFVQIAAVPRPSKKEQKIVDHVSRIAREHHLDFVRDPTGNVLVKKPASPGKERASGVVLQAHLDMVCEKNSSSRHDFEHDGIVLQRVDGYITAKETTLGADNGIGVAAALSIMLDSSLEHGPLEFLFTVDEETGLTGAHGLTAGFLAGRTLLNLDSEEDGALYIGCSGGRDTILRMKIIRTAPADGAKPVRISVGGLRGGHSGLEIDKGRGNAIQMMGRVLRSLDGVLEYSIAGIEGGSKRNAIPRECSALLYVPERELGTLQEKVKQIAGTLQSECRKNDPDLSVEATQDDQTICRDCIEKTQTRVLLRLLAALPHGVVAMSPDIPDLVETSTNLATIETAAGEVTIGTSQRSSVASALEEIVRRVVVVGELAGAGSEHTDGYPGWEPDLDSAVLRTAIDVYHDLFGKEPEVKAIHAGLECGIIGERYPHMDMVSFGPTIEHAHSPDERVEIASVAKFWTFLVTLLRTLS